MIAHDNVVSIGTHVPDENRLVLEALQGDRQAFGALVLAHESMLRRMAWSLLASEADCCDAVQEAVFKAWRGLPKLRRPDWFKSWLVRILINECRQIHRHRRRFAEIPTREPAAPPHATDDALDVTRALASLPDSQRIPILLYYYDDFSVEMIARTLKLPAGTVKSRLYAARKQLRRLLEVDES